MWPPGCGRHCMPHPPVMTYVQHFVSRIKKRQRWDVQTMWAYDLGGQRDCLSYMSSHISNGMTGKYRMWLSMFIVSLFMSTKCKFLWYNYSFWFMVHWANTAQTDRMTLRPWPLRSCACGWCVSSSSICIPSLKCQHYWDWWPWPLTVWIWKWYASCM